MTWWHILVVEVDTAQNWNTRLCFDNLLCFLVFCLPSETGSSSFLRPRWADDIWPLQIHFARLSPDARLQAGMADSPPPPVLVHSRSPYYYPPHLTNEISPGAVLGPWFDCYDTQPRTWVGSVTSTMLVFTCMRVPRSVLLFHVVARSRLPRGCHVMPYGRGPLKHLPYQPGGHIMRCEEASENLRRIYDPSAWYCSCGKVLRWCITIF